MWSRGSPAGRAALPRLDRVDVLVFAGNHGVTAQGVSAYPGEVTAQMVANFAAGGAAINQLAATAGAALRVIPLSLEQPTADFTQEPAMDEAAISGRGRRRLCGGRARRGSRLPRRNGHRQYDVAAAAIAAALFGGGGARWAGRGTGVDDAGPRAQASRRSIARSRAMPALLGDPLQVAAALGGRELAAILGAALAARRQNIPVLLDGFVCTAAVAPLARLRADALAHAWAAHVSAEAGHRAAARGARPRALLDLSMRLGEASGAALAVLILRAALACHTGMATFAEAGVSGKS